MTPRVTDAIAAPTPSPRARSLFWLALAAGVFVRIFLLPTPGYVDDLTEFAGWIRHIGSAGLAHAYDVRLTLGPVMAYIWSLLAVIGQSLPSGIDPADPFVRILMKLPATLADLGLAAAVFVALRPRPGWAA